MRVLLAEDEKKIARFIRKRLLEEGYAVDLACEGDEALALFMAGTYDCAVLDIMMPGLDGLGIVRRMRERKNTTPILLLSARNAIEERVEGLNVGADDYLPKPFSMDELVARVRALLRRTGGEKTPRHTVGDLVLCPGTRKVQRGNRRIELTPREFAMLEALMVSAGRVVTRTQLTEKVWEYHFDPGTNLVDVYVQRLRRKIDDGEKTRLLHTVRGVGYTIRVEEWPA